MKASAVCWLRENPHDRPSLDRQRVMTLAELGFIGRHQSVHLLGPPGVGKTDLATAFGILAVKAGHAVYFTTLSDLISSLTKAEREGNLVSRLRYVNRHADLLFDVINRRHELKPTIVTTNKPSSDWGEVFPNAACVVSIVDRLVYHSQVLLLEGESYRMHEATQRAKKKKQTTRKTKPKPVNGTDEGLST